MKSGVRCVLAERHPQEVHEGGDLLSGRDLKWRSEQSDEMAKE
jgi:hypothetical protein